MSTKRTIYTIKNFRKTTENNNAFALGKDKVDECILYYAKGKNKI